jgi:hypothetical protein
MNYTYSLLKGLKRRFTQGNLVDYPSHRCGESLFDYEYLCEFEAKIGTDRKVVICKGPKPNRVMQQIEKSSSSPCPFKTRNCHL